MSYADLEMKVIWWAEARKIIPNGTMIGQAKKTVEEAGEVLEAAEMLARTDLTDEERTKWKRKYRDAIGDTLVTLITGCALADENVLDCLAQAYDEIKNRKGTLGADGIFYREA